MQYYFFFTLLILLYITINLFYAVVKVISILQHSDVAKDIKVNSLIEIFYKYPISGIELEDGSLIWSRG